MVDHYPTEAPPTNLIDTLAIGCTAVPFPYNPAIVRGPCSLVLCARDRQQGLLWARVVTRLDTLYVQGPPTVVEVNTIEGGEINDPDPAPGCADASR